MLRNNEMCAVHLFVSYHKHGDEAMWDLCGIYDPLKPKVAVPDVVGMNLSETEAALAGTGHLALGALAEAYLAAQPAGQIFMQNPDAGMQVS